MTYIPGQLMRASLLASLVIAMAMLGTAKAAEDESESTQDRSSDSSSQSSTQSDDSQQQQQDSADRDSSQREQSGQTSGRRSARQNERSREYGDRQSSRQSQRTEWSEHQSTGSHSHNQDAALGIQIGADDDEGVLVVSVFRNSPAEEMGLKQGDRITEINGETIESERDFLSKINDMSPGDEIELSVQRDEEEEKFSGELESREDALASRGRQGRSQQRGGSRQASYQDRSSRSDQDLENRLAAIERQFDRLSREIENLREAIDSRNEQGNETASYTQDEDHQSTTHSQARRTNDGGRSESTRRGQNQATNRQHVDSPGGEVGEERQRPGNSRFGRD